MDSLITHLENMKLDHNELQVFISVGTAAVEAARILVKAEFARASQE